MRFFLTGHTGFKGAWFALGQELIGNEIFGYSLEPIKEGIFLSAHVNEIMTSDVRGDIRDYKKLSNAMIHSQPDVVVHMAAQPLVINSHENPYDTYETNVQGTLNVLDAARKTKSIKLIAIVTTDKVYMQNKKIHFSETDEIGASDPYSTSKAMADLLAQSWSMNHSEVPIIILRAGNVIGGGDVSPNRLIPDIVRAGKSNSVPVIRYPNAVRPWQHVLDCLRGYQLAIEWGLANKIGGVFNFGPHSQNSYTVGEVASEFIDIMGYKEWKSVNSSFAESDYLQLDSTKAMHLLGWQNTLSMKDALTMTGFWYRAQGRGENMFEISRQQIREIILK
jgi:CDP-glucose 4,6-dehydratase